MPIKWMGYVVTGSGWYGCAYIADRDREHKDTGAQVRVPKGNYMTARIAAMIVRMCAVMEKLFVISGGINGCCVSKCRL